MISSDGKKYIYEKHQLVEVICQLRFPTILSIDTDTPAAFQEHIRARFPRYEVREESVPSPGGMQKQKIHSFISADGSYKLSLCKGFIALSTMRYRSWEDFAQWLDEPLGHFISVYKPAFFERIGLRCLNGISREKLEMEHCRWSDLVQSRYLGPLDDDDLDEATLTKCSVDVEMKLPGCLLRLHAGPGFIKRAVRTPKGIQQLQEPKPRFILDLDLYSAGTLYLKDAAGILETLHSEADRIFSEAITELLHDAMDPVEI